VLVRAVLPFSNFSPSISALTLTDSLSNNAIIPGLQLLHILFQFSLIRDMPSDAQRIQKVKLLIDAGYTHRLLLAHDIHTKHRLVSDGHIPSKNSILQKMFN